jgi:hypothetical protein
MSKSAGASEDPFYAVREYGSIFSSLKLLIYFCSNVQTYVDRIKVRHEKFQDMVMNVNTANNNEFKEMRKGLEYKLINLFII